jgi:type III restriction enzyme
VHNINVLTVVASESYESFAKELQNQIAESLSDRPRKADVDFFIDKVLTNERQETMSIDERLAKKIHNSFIRNNYLDDDDRLTKDYFQAVENSEVKLPDEFNNYRQEVLGLVSSIYSEVGNPLVNNERDENIKEIKLSDNFYKKEFQDLWNKINVKTAYTVKFDTDELIDKCIAELDKSLNVSDIIYQVKAGELERISSKEQLKKGEGFKVMESKADWLQANVTASIKYDLIGKLVDETKLTRKTTARILSGIKPLTFMQFQKNPEEFILKTAKTINEQKATAVIERITYDIIGENYDNDIFTQNNLKGKIGHNALAVDNHVYDYVVADSKTELKFAEELDVSNEVCVYAKMPRGFFIPTPVGNYNPDWAIVFNEGAVKHIYFIAETKGSMDSLELRKIEDAKIHCAEKHFEKISNKTVKYGVVNSYEKLLEIVK